MAERGGQPGNKNAAKARLPWSQALKRSLTRLAAENGEESPNYRRGLDKVADAVVRDAAAGDKDAWMELGNRLEGKSRQGMDIDANVNAQITKIINELV